MPANLLNVAIRTPLKRESDVTRTLAWLLVAMLTAAVPASAQTYPSKPIRFVVPYAPGGIVDTAARIIGAKLTEAWGQQIVVDNKPGGNATIGMSAAAKAAPDGYTILIASSGDYMLAPALLKDLSYDVE